MRRVFFLFLAISSIVHAQVRGDIQWQLDPDISPDKELILRLVRKMGIEPELVTVAHAMPSGER